MLRSEISTPPEGVSLTFDVSAWPLVLVTMPATTRDEDIDYLTVAYRPVHAAPSRHALIVDTSTIVTIPDARLRKRLRDFEADNRRIIKKTNICSGIVISNTVVRGAYTALRWISPPTTPSQAFPTVRAAARWCIECLQNDGLRVPTPARALAGLSESA